MTARRRDAITLVLHESSSTSFRLRVSVNDLQPFFTTCMKHSTGIRKTQQTRAMPTTPLLWYSKMSDRVLLREEISLKSG